MVIKSFISVLVCSATSYSSVGWLFPDRLTYIVDKWKPIGKIFDSCGFSQDFRAADLRPGGRGIFLRGVPRCRPLRIPGGVKKMPENEELKPRSDAFGPKMTVME